MIERTEGLVLRTHPLTESSLIVHWLTRDFGRVATVARGARRAASPFRGKLDLFYLADLSFSRSRRTDLHTLREVMLRKAHRPLRNDLAHLRQASYCSALIEQSTETDTPLPGLFQLMTGLLEYLPAQPAQPLTLFAFETKLLAELGLMPDLPASKLTPGARQILNTLSAIEWPALSRLRLSAAQVTELRRFLDGFLVFHLGTIPRGRDHALAVGAQ